MWHWGHPPSQNAHSHPDTEATENQFAPAAGQLAPAGGQVAQGQGSFQSTGAAPWASSSWFARLNGREPKKPLCADSGLG